MDNKQALEIFNRLETELHNKQPRLERLLNYYTNDTPITDNKNLNNSTKQLQNDLMKLSSTNLCQLIINAVVSRLRPLNASLRLNFDNDETDSFEEDNLYISRSFTKLQLKVRLQHFALLLALYGEAYLYVSENSIAPISPENIAVEYDEVEYWNVKHALYKIDSHDKTTYYLFLTNDDGSIEFRIKEINADYQTSGGWVKQDNGDDLKILDTHNEIPIYASQTPFKMGQFEAHIPQINRINTLTFNRQLIMAWQAFKQIVIKSDTLDYVNENGQNIEWDKLILFAPNTVTRLPQDTTIEQLSEVDTTQFTVAIEAELKVLASASSTPLYMLVPNAVESSATGASIARETLTAKVEQLIDASSQTISKSLWMYAYLNNKKLNGFVDIEWQASDYSSMAEKASIASMLDAILPYEAIWSEIFKFSPEKIEYFRQLEEEEETKSTELFDEIGAYEDDNTPSLDKDNKDEILEDISSSDNGEI